MTKKQRQEYIYRDRVGFIHIGNIKGRLVERIVKEKVIYTIKYKYELYTRYDGVQYILRREREDKSNKWEIMATKENNK